MGFETDGKKQKINQFNENEIRMIRPVLEPEPIRLFM
jgi:hypothetical protein